MTTSKNKRDLYRRIIAALKHGPLSTRDLAETLGGNMSVIYRICREMEADDLLKSTKVDGVRLIFCIDDKKVVTGEDYEECKEKGHDFRSFRNKVRIWRIR
jgi:DNA-binding transcriptional regulator YhcF (GntR family)